MKELLFLVLIVKTQPRRIPTQDNIYNPKTILLHSLFYTPLFNWNRIGANNETILTNRNCNPIFFPIVNNFINRSSFIFPLTANNFSFSKAVIKKSGNSAFEIPYLANCSPCSIRICSNPADGFPFSSQTISHHLAIILFL